MEINYLVDLNNLRSAPRLSKSQRKRFSEELESNIFNADWITIGIMASTDYKAIKALKSISYWHVNRMPSPRPFSDLI